MEQEAGLWYYLEVLALKWWVVALTVVIGTALALFYSLSLPEEYEARTQLLVVSRTSERLVDSNQVANPVGASLSADTLSNLARANDLLADIITELSPSNPGHPIMAVETLRGMVQTRVEVTKRGTLQTPLPLLTTTVRGSDPQLVKNIAKKWAELFIRRNAQLFATDSARSYEFILSQYDENQRALDIKSQERLAYLKQNPLQPLQSELKVLTAKYEEFLSQLESKRAALTAAHARLDSLNKALTKESQFIELRRGISNEGIFNLLAENPSERTLQTMADITVMEQVQNPVYLSLSQDLAGTTTAVATLSAEVAYLEAKTPEFKASVKKLSSKIGEIQLRTSGLEQQSGEIQLRTSGLLDQEIQVLQNNVNLLAANLHEARLAKEEQGSAIQVVESAILPQVAVESSRSRTVLTGGVLGLALGVFLVLLIHSQRQSARARLSPEPVQQPTPDESSTQGESSPNPQA